jgi:hypothetical protein
LLLPTHSGAELLAGGLSSNRTLLCLDLSSNKIGDAGALAIAQALSGNGSSALAELNLNQNCIGAGSGALGLGVGGLA